MYHNDPNTKTIYDLLSAEDIKLLENIEQVEQKRLNDRLVSAPRINPPYYIPSELNLNYYEEMAKYQRQAISDEHRIELLEEYIEDLGQTLNHLKEKLDGMDKSKEV
jgi:hypothetical protein